MPKNWGQEEGARSTVGDMCYDEAALIVQVFISIYHLGVQNELTGTDY